MGGRPADRRLLRSALKVGGEDAADGPVGRVADADRPAAGGVQPVRAMLVCGTDHNLRGAQMDRDQATRRAGSGLQR